jgi:hypothetical protein
MKRKGLLLAVIFCQTALLYGQYYNNNGPEIIDNTYLHLKIIEADENTVPYIWQDYFVLSFSDGREHRFVGVVFDFENYSVVHSFIRTPNGTYVYYARLPETDKIKYRLIVDSVWQEDTKNNNYEVDAAGIKVSVLNLPKRSRNISGPVIRRSEGVIDFYLNAPPQSQIFLMGSFSNWDPFMFPLTEIREGFYHVAVPLNSGTYYYTFLLNGRRFTDPANLDKFIIKSTGELVNRIEMPSGN